MRGFGHLMFPLTPGRVSNHARRLVLTVFCIISFHAALSFNTAFAQTDPFGVSPVPSLEGVYAVQPPLVSPQGNAPAKNFNGPTLGEWMLTPTLRVFAISDSNLYASPEAVSASGWRIYPSLLAQWTNGIHTTSLYGQLDTRLYPELSSSNTLDRQAGFIQRYEALRDLVFGVQADYIHLTNAPSLVGAIPGPTSSPANSGAQGSGGSDQGPTVFNPFNRYTGTAWVEKMFNRAYLRLTTSLSETEYESAQTPNFNVKTVVGSGGIWLGPLVYAFADADDSFTTLATGATVNANRWLAGLGSARVGLFRASLYAGHQGSQSDDPVEGSQTAGGIIYGGKIAYYPTPFLTVSLAVDETENLSSGSSTSCPLALASSTAATTPIPVSTCASTRLTSVSVPVAFKLWKEWSAYARLDYERIEHLVTPELDTAWVASAGFRYELQRNWMFTIDYQHTWSLSDVPLVGYTRNFITAGTTYRF
jgi:hypothetical protein